MIKKILLAFILSSTTILVAQRNNSSPYSFFGIGDEFNSQTVEQSSMGGIGAAFNSSHYLNFINPAANANLRFSTFSVGGLFTDLTLKDNSGNQSGTSTSLRYIALGFPIGKKAGFSAGLQPKSSVGYSLLNLVADSDNNATQLTRFSGSGGTNKLYGAFGINVLEGLSVGAEVGFIFGNIDNEIVDQRLNVALATKHEETNNIRGGVYKLGVQYQKELPNKLQLNAGASFQLENNLTSRSTQRLYSLTVGSAGNEIPRDTVFSSSTTSSFKSPLKTALGLGIGKENKWYVGVNYQFQDALENNNSIVNATYEYEKSNKFSIGGFYLPKINSISSYWHRVTYRAGFRTENTGLALNTNNNFTSIKDFGINLGLGLPIGRRSSSNIGLSNINIGVEYGQRGDINLVKENYFNFRLSLSLNDLWFRKREID